MIIRNYYDRGVHCTEELDGTDPMIETATKRFLFVYGTLKQGCHNNTLLSRARFVGEAQTFRPRVMMDGGIPFLVKAEKYLDARLDLNWASRVKGHIFEIDEYELADCDRLESHPNWYRREIDYFTLRKCQMVSAYVYYLNPDRVKTHRRATPEGGLFNLPLISAPVVSEWRSKRYA
jgi:gamma-glutamylcyclotransferase (GGCT)/AIG2-like uncharacterized protein YtfP